MTGLRVPVSALHAASAVWDEQSTTLHGAVGTLDDADVSCLGPRTRGAAAAFLRQWSQAVAGLERDAASHALALDDAARLAVGTDVVVSDRLTGLLPRGGA